MSDPSPDVVVIGGGIIGTAAAAMLAEAGVTVTLVERDGLASGASGANSGVVQHPFDPVLAELYRETLAAYRDLVAMDVPFSIASQPSGLLYVSRDEAAVRAMDASLATTFPELGRAVLGGDDLRAVEPTVAPDLWACRVDIGFPVQPAASTYAYATLAERRGVRIRAGRSAAIQHDGDRATGVVVDDRSIAADAVLVAAGPWSPALIDPSGAWSPIVARWGVVVETALPAGPGHVLEEAEIEGQIGDADPDAPPAAEHVDFSLVPLDGIGAVGSTFLADEPRPADWVERLLGRAATFIPAVADAPIRGTRACARPYSLDGRPLIGPVPGRLGLFVCAGNGSWGISTGPASARLVVEQILGRSPVIPPGLDPGRFGAPPPVEAGRP